MIKKSTTEESKALQRAKKNKPRLGHSYDRSTTKTNGKLSLSEILRTFSEKVITHKLDNLFYWAEKDRVELPLDLIPEHESQLYNHFMSRIMKLDPLFQNKLYFYLAKENVDYQQVDQFLNLYIVRFWPEVACVVYRDKYKKSSPTKENSFPKQSTYSVPEKTFWKRKVQDKSTLKRLE